MTEKSYMLILAPLTSCELTLQNIIQEKEKFCQFILSADSTVVQPCLVQIQLPLFYTFYLCLIDQEPIYVQNPKSMGSTVVKK